VHNLVDDSLQVKCQLHHSFITFANSRGAGIQAPWSLFTVSRNTS